MAALPRNAHADRLGGLCGELEGGNRYEKHLFQLPLALSPIPLFDVSTLDLIETEFDLPVTFPQFREILPARVFSWGVRGFGGERPLVAGEYAFPPAVSARSTMQILQSGKVVARNLTIPEGLTALQVVAMVEAAEGLGGELPVLGTVGEGTLLPETYQYVRGERRDEVVAPINDDDDLSDRAM